MFSTLRRSAVAVRRFAVPSATPARAVARAAPVAVPTARAVSSTIARPVARVSAGRSVSMLRPTRVLLNKPAPATESLDGNTHAYQFNHQYDNADVTDLAKELTARRSEEPFLIPPFNDKNPQVFFEVTIAGKPAGKIQIEVRQDIAPKAAENFKALATGAGKLSYKGSKLYEWFSGYYVNGGDITNNNGTGGDSIYGGDFVGEQSDNPMGIGSIHLLASKMDSEEAHIGKRDVVNSKFSILMIDMPSVLAGQGVLVGQVLKGMEVLEDVQANPVTQNNNFFKPSVDVTISNCGEVAEADKLKQEDFKDKLDESEMPKKKAHHH